MDNKNLTFKEGIEYLRISQTLGYRLVREGKLPSKKIGGKIIFVKDQLDKWLSEGN